MKREIVIRDSNGFEHSAVILNRLMDSFEKPNLSIAAPDDQPSDYKQKTVGEPLTNNNGEKTRGETVKFKSKVNVEYEGGEGSAEIDWEVSFEVRSWGIKDIYPFVPQQEVTLNLKFNGEDGDRYEEKTVKISQVETEIHKESFIVCLDELRFDGDSWLAVFNG